MYQKASFSALFFIPIAKYGFQEVNNIRKILCAAILISVVVFLIAPVSAEERFPSPEFVSQYQIPRTIHPGVRADLLEYLDVFVLILALAIASYFAIKKRSRNGLYLMTVFSIVYFGFYRKGCVCSVGSLQNVTLSLFDSGYLIPLVVLLFFTIPLVFALFYGRVFCSSACPLGAVQEVVIYKPVKLPAAVKHLLGIIPYIYLGTVTLFAATGSGFIICRYDPFVGFFRLSGPFGIMLLGAGFLITGIFIARPYCRFFCPYGVLLGIFSFFSRKHLKITPDECIQCKLCENSCPVDAINIPSPKTYKIDKEEGIKKFGVYLLIAPVIIFLMGWGFSQMTDIFSRYNSTVRLAEQVYREEMGTAFNTTLDSDAFWEKEEPVKELYNQASNIRRKFYKGMWILGLFLGIVVVLKIINLFLRRTSEDYEPDRFHCISCGRCMEYCPVQAVVEKSNEHS